MPKNTEHAARDERLAAKLRENLHRRKAQARDQAGKPPPAAPASADTTESELENDSDALSNPPPES